MAENVADKWINIPLGECGQIVSGGTPSTKISEYWNGDIAWITPADLSGYTDKYIARGRKSITAKGLQNSSARLMPPGSVLFSSRAPVGYVAIAAGELCTNQGFKSLIPYESIDNTYLYYFFKFAKDSIEDQASGTTFKEISAKTFSQISVPVPPFPEQRRIVSRIEKLFSELDKAVETLKTLQQQLKVYRQAVLKSAFQGKLTNNPSHEEIPTTWKWTTLGEVSESSLGKMLDKEKNNGELEPYLRNINVRWGAFDLTDLLTMKFEKSENDKYSVRRGDLVICEGGEPGRAAIWNFETYTIKIQKALHRVRFHPDVSNRYFYYYLYFIAKSNLLERYFTGTTIKHLPQEKLRGIIFPLCSLKEQSQIVQEIESRLSVSDKIEETIEYALQQAEALRQSILKKAFEGRLLSETELEEVRREPDWEPASVLLEKINAQKASTTALTPAKKTARKGKKQA